MNKIAVVARLVSGDLLDFEFGEAFVTRLKRLQGEGLTGKLLIHELITDDWAAPPLAIEIKGTTSQGERIDIRIPYV